MTHIRVAQFFKKFPFLSNIILCTEEWTGRGSEPDAPCAAFGCTKKGFHTHHSVHTYMDPVNTDKVEIKPITVEFMEVRPLIQFHDEGGGYRFDYERVFLLDKAGNVLTEVTPTEERTFRSALIKSTKIEGETVSKALFRLDDPAAVFYAVAHKISSRHGEPTTVTIFKPPKDFGLKDWVAEQKRRADTQISAEIAAIDAEADLSVIVYCKHCGDPVRAQCHAREQGKSCEPGFALLRGWSSTEGAVDLGFSRADVMILHGLPYTHRLHQSYNDGCSVTISWRQADLIDHEALEYCLNNMETIMRVMLKTGLQPRLPHAQLAPGIGEWIVSKTSINSPCDGSILPLAELITAVYTTLHRKR